MSRFNVFCNPLHFLQVGIQWLIFKFQNLCAPEILNAKMV